MTLSLDVGKKPRTPFEEYTDHHRCPARDSGETMRPDARAYRSHGVRTPVVHEKGVAGQWLFGWGHAKTDPAPTQQGSRHGTGDPMLVQGSTKLECLGQCMQIHIFDPCTAVHPLTWDLPKPGNRGPLVRTCSVPLALSSTVGTAEASRRMLLPRSLSGTAGKDPKDGEHSGKPIESVSMFCFPWGSRAYGSTHSIALPKGCIRKSPTNKVVSSSEKERRLPGLDPSNAPGEATVG